MSTHRHNADTCTPDLKILAIREGSGEFSRRQTHAHMARRLDKNFKLQRHS
jgi:hypothetical protein